MFTLLSVTISLILAFMCMYIKSQMSHILDKYADKDYRSSSYGNQHNYVSQVSYFKLDNI